ncbi:DUF2971 domain-containing protein [Marivita hallyeonensis]|uniref:DUF2971 domain-containing protein n=1 Tax=Marivita hallyeonensis TaxID=996342 RepID=A0A1M5NND4_9RHOB|nr:DUF2971 domain-containing protein [Marivita hallyeonensis]SHG90699.1 Protein of unknown function [Marivita hallyeonensis]
MDIPRSIFRYRSASTPYFFDEIDNALNSNLFLSPIVAQNDPFDCFPYYNTSKVRDIKKFEEDHLKRKLVVSEKSFEKKFGNLPRKQRQREKKWFKWSYKNRQLENKIIEKMLELERQKTLIACFSEINDNILMWSHYADSHSGVCLIFGVTDQDDHFANEYLPMSIIYSDDRPEITTIDVIKFTNQDELKGKFDEDRDRIFDALVRQKPCVWEYEKEWRIQHKSEDGSAYYHVPSIELKGMILGLRMDKDVRTSVIERYSSRLELFQTNTEKNTYKIGISRL